MKRTILAIIFSLVFFHVDAEEYLGSFFGLCRDGKTDNTEAVQHAIDFISSKGGGTLVIEVGGYVLGSVQMKDNVTIRITPGAIIEAPANYYNYYGRPALFYARGCRNIRIEGDGIIRGHNDELKTFMENQKGKGHLPQEACEPAIILFEDCENVSFGTFYLYDAPEDPVRLVHTPYTVDNIYINEGKRWIRL
ncbi:MAG: hypothetical protein MJY56_00225 [Bacteroidales bacterium]|nr:hypothetical protein [Bacteroidales bacterium]